MSPHHHQSESRGALLRPPALKVYCAGIDTTARDAGPRWGRQFVRSDWQPVRLQWGINGRPSTLQVRVVLGAGPGHGRLRPEDAYCSPGDRIRLVQVGAGSGPGGTVELEWFRGLAVAESLLIQTGPDVESYTVTACGPELRLRQKVVTGQWWPRAELDALEIAAGQGTDDGQLTYAAATQDGVWEAHLPVVLNPDGRGNASGSNWRLIGNASSDDTGPSKNRCKVFTSPDRSAGQAQSVPWTPCTALRSVIAWVDGGEVISDAATNWPALETLLGTVPLGTLDLTGKTLLEAMQAILGPLGFGFALAPWAAGDGAHRLIVFPRHNPAVLAQVYMPAVAGGQVSIASAEGQRAQVQRLAFTRDNRSVRNRVMVVGDVKLTQRTLVFHETQSTRDLHPYWDATTYDLADYADNNLIGPHTMSGDSKLAEWRRRYEQGDDDYRHVFRTFVWNEDGALSDVVQDGAGDALLPDLSEYGPENAASTAAHRPRPIGPRLEYADEGLQSGSAGSPTAGAFKALLIEFGIATYQGGEFVVDEDAWIALSPAQAAARPDRAAATILEPDLLTWRPWLGNQTTSGGKTLHETYGHLNYPTLLHNTLRVATDGSCLLRIRVTGSLEMDGSVRCESPRQLDSSWPLDATRLVCRPEHFKYRAHGTTVSESLPATVDDSAGDDSPMLRLAEQVRDAGQDAHGHGSVVLRGLHRGYEPGMGLAEIAGRAIDLSVRGPRHDGAAVVPSITGVSWAFEEGANKTELVLDMQRPATTR